MRSSTDVCCEEPCLGRRQPRQELEAEVLGHEPIVAGEARGPAELGAPACNDSAARYKPAGHPSVRSVSSESSLASSSTPAAPSSNPASCSSSRRSATPISSPVPAPASGQAAAPAPPGSRSRSASPPELFEQRGDTSRQDGLATAWRSSSTSTSGRSSAASALPRRGTRLVQVDPPGPTARRTPRAGPVRRGESPPRRTAGTPGVVVRPSSATHANGRGSASAHRASSVVLPYPAGATTVTNGAARCRTAARSLRLRHGAGPGQRRGELDLQEVRKNLSKFNHGAGCYGKEFTRLTTPRRPVADCRSGRRRFTPSG